MMVDHERWLAIPGFTGLYEVSSYGRVRSLSRRRRGKAGSTSSWRGRVLRDTTNTHGYRQVTLMDSDTKPRQKMVHQLVALAFLGESSGLYVRHLDGNRNMNFVENLKYGTISENAQDALAHGTHFNANKTRCPRDHEYDYVAPDGRRSCSICKKELKKKRDGLLVLG